MQKILLIEDDAVMRENTAELLKLAGYDVAVAENGKKGVQMALNARPDLVICDVSMPELDGYGTLSVLTKNPATASIPFIFLTARADKADLRKGMDLGADDYLTKPFEDTELMNAVETRFKKSAVLKQEFARDLRGLNAFLDEACGVKELESLSRNRPAVRYARKDIVFHEGDVPQHLYFLQAGRVKTYKAHAEDKEYVTCLHRPGDFFGYVSLLKDGTHNETAMAMEDCEICKIPKGDFTALLYKNRDVAAKFIKMLSGNVSRKEEQLLSLAYDTVRKRVAETLLAMRERAFPAAPARVRINREDLAGLAGTATETVIRSLSDLKAEKLIEMDGRDIVILNEQGLRDLKW